MNKGSGMDRLTEALEKLPIEGAVPHGLDQRVLGNIEASGRPTGVEQAQARGSHVGSGFGVQKGLVGIFGQKGELIVGLVAGLGLGLLWGDRQRVRLEVGPEELLVEGQVKVGLNTAQLTVDGKVGLRGEPPRGEVRGSNVEVPMDLRSGLAGALTGGLLTMVVYEGKAMVEAPGRAPEEVRAGESRRLTSESEKRKTASEGGPTGAGPVVPQVADGRIAALEMENSMLRGQLAAYGGAPVEWPADLPGAFRAEAWANWARSQAVGLEGYALLEVDCAEFPCLAVFSGEGAKQREDGGVDWDPAVSRFEAPPPGSPEGTEVGLGVSAMRNMDESGKPVDRMVLWAAPREYLDGNVQNRLKSRAESLVEASEDEENAEE
jgi:hypothetical protein